MTAFEIFAIAWIPFSIAIVIGFAFSAEWIEARLFGTKTRHPAEEPRPVL